MGIVFRCLDLLLIIGVLGANLPLFHYSASLEARKEIKQIRMLYGEDTWSDHHIDNQTHPEAFCLL